MNVVRARKTREYREVLDAVNQAARSIPSLRLIDLGMVRRETGEYPFCQISLKGAHRAEASARRVYIAGGIHGDEPGGVWAVLEFLRRYPGLPDLYQHFDFTILPCANPSGYELDTRENAAGIDLNRQFKNMDPPHEVVYVKKAIADGPFVISMELHEDLDSTGFYLYELTQDGAPSLGRQMLARIGEKFPINRSETIEGMRADDGLIARELDDAGFRVMIERRSDWPQSFYHYRNGNRHSFTTETPVHLTREERVEIHLIALESALEQVLESQGGR